MGFRFKVTGEAGICLTTTQKAIKRSAPVTAPFDSLFLLHSPMKTVYIKAIVTINKKVDVISSFHEAENLRDAIDEFYDDYLGIRSDKIHAMITDIRVFEGKEIM